jgi:hypothetical protein
MLKPEIVDGTCECDCSIGFPKPEVVPYKEYDVLCPSHGGTEEEQEAFRERLCEQEGHYFPAMYNVNSNMFCEQCRVTITLWEDYREKESEGC